MTPPSNTVKAVVFYTSQSSCRQTSAAQRKSTHGTSIHCSTSSIGYTTAAEHLMNEGTCLLGSNIMTETEKQGSETQGKTGRSFLYPLCVCVCVRDNADMLAMCIYYTSV